MKIGFVGVGKLGLPCAVALDAAGHDVIAYDVSDAPRRYLEERAVPYTEAGLPELLEHHTVRWAESVDALVADSDVVFVAVQTPHRPAYDGTRPAPAERRDFEYGFLVQAVRDVCRAAERQEHAVAVTVVSTVLPGTFNRHLRPLANRWAALVYSPAFIAMGTTVADFTSPEFVLIGTDDPASPAMWSVTEVFEKVHDRPLRVVSIESAELTKVAYNVYLSAKIAFANYIGEIAHKTGADADEVTDSLALATERILSPRYMRAGMGDGGGCHPRDLIALSHLAERADLSFDLAGALMSAREEHSSWLAGLARDWARTVRLPIVVLGRAYKPESNLCLGSPAALLVSQLRTPKATPESWDPHIDTAPAPSHRAVFVVATKHAEFATFDYPPGSVVLDPWGYVEDRPGVTVVRIGRKG